MNRDRLIEVIARVQRNAWLDPWDEPTAEQIADAILADADTDIRCDAQFPTGQCLDHQGHLGDHQPPSEDR